MQFNFLNDAFDFYTSYSVKGGSGVCKHSTNFHKITKELCSQVFVYSEGHCTENEYRFHGKKEGKISNGMDMGIRKRKRKTTMKEKRQIIL